MCAGLCYVLNCFLFELLLALEYNAYLTLTNYGEPFLIPNHSGVIIRDVIQTNDTYLMDVGLSFPTFRAICLDIQHRTADFKDSYQTYRYTRQAAKRDGDWDTYSRKYVSRQESKIETNNNENEANPSDLNWKTKVTFNLKSVTFEYLAENMDRLKAQRVSLFRIHKSNNTNSTQWSYNCRSMIVTY